MTIPIIIFFVGALGLFFFLKGNSQKKSSEISSLEGEQNSLQSNYEFLADQKRELNQEIQDTENELSRLRNGQEGIQTYTTKEMEIGEVDESELVSRYLLKEGKISLEQNENALDKMETMKLDFLGTCLTLGYIDIDTAKKAAKVNKLAVKLS